MMDMNPYRINEYYGMYCETSCGEITAIFKMEKGFHEEYVINDDVSIELTHANAKEASNLNDLKIEVDNSQETGAIEIDKDIFHARVIKEYKKIK